jgi:transcriptional regulator with XRE-family HTH domain
MEEFINWVRNELKHRGWLQEDIVKRGGISSGAISKVMSGERNPGPEFCRAIAKAFNISQQEVFVRARLMDPPPKYDPDIARILYKIAELKPEYRTDIEDNIDAKLKRQKQPIDGGVKIRTGKTPVLNG